MSLAEVVTDYCGNTNRRKGGKTHQQHLDDDLKRFRKLSLIDAIRTAALCVTAQGKRQGHQRRIKKKALNGGVDALLAGGNRLKQCSGFDKLHELVSEIVSDIKGLGPLYRYDVSLRIGAHLKIMPKKVYLHAGTRMGAKKLGLDTSNDVLEENALPPALRRVGKYKVKAHEAEDIICIYKGRFR